MREIDLAGLSTFLRVVEEESFTQAGGQLGLSASAVSQRIRRLEDQLGARLLNRTTRSVRPTAVGAHLAQEIKAAFDNIHLATQLTQESQGRVGGLLRLTTSAVGAELLLAPAIGPFRQAHPDVQLNLSIGDRLVDIVEGGFDAGLRRGDLLDTDMIHQRVSPDVTMVLVASPAYLAGRPAPAHPRALREHDCITVNGLYDGSVRPWRFRQGDTGLELKIDGTVAVNTPTLALGAAVSGAGLAYLASDHVGQAVAAGQLTPVLPEWGIPRLGFFLYYPNNRHTLPAVRAFGKFMAARMKAKG